ncbi:MAG: mechanosensitive ion channel domain-containing protein, partial [Halieaceae bacterium]|jgi:small-conductance mechanosensitive channel|nr:mechanosensitive ion channel domain-containing protein [Halieaceae bacterium]
VPADATLESVRLDTVAGSARERIAEAVREYREDRSPARLRRNTVILLGITLAVALVLWLVVVLFRWLIRVTERRVKRQIEQLEQASHRILDARQIWGWVGGLLRALRALSIFALVMLWLETALGLYPWTRPLAAQLFMLVLDPLKKMGNGFLANLPDLIFLAVLFLVVRFCMRIVRTFFVRVDRGWIRLATFERELAMPTYRIVRLLIIVFALVIAYPYIPGSDSEAFKGMSIFFGVVLSIGSSSFIANIIAGYSLTYRRAFREGDRIMVGESEGTVIEMTTLNTRIRSLKNEEINIPNSMVLGSAIVNYTTFERDPGLILHTNVGIGYDVAWRQVEAMLLAAASRTEGLKKEPAPFVLQKSLGDFTAVYQLNAYCLDASRMNGIYSALHGHIQDVFNEYGVQIMSPNYVADPPDAKLVPPQNWYPAPAEPPPGQA